MRNNCKVTILFLVLSVFLIAPLFSQNNEASHSFQIRPLGIWNSVYGSFLAGDSEAYAFDFLFEYQYAANKNINVSVSPFFSIQNRNDLGERYYLDNSLAIEGVQGYVKEVSYGVDPGIVIRPYGTGLRGFYIKPNSRIGISHINIPDQDIDDTIVTLGINIELGYQWIFAKGFTIQLGGTIGTTWGIPIGDREAEYRTYYFGRAGLIFGLGYSF